MKTQMPHGNNNAKCICSLVVSHVNISLPFWLVTNCVILCGAYCSPKQKLNLTYFFHLPKSLFFSVKSQDCLRFYYWPSVISRHFWALSIFQIMSNFHKIKKFCEMVAAFHESRNLQKIVDFDYFLPNLLRNYNSLEPKRKQSWYLTEKIQSFISTNLCRDSFWNCKQS